jgi:uncharacterized membrane protein
MSKRWLGIVFVVAAMLFSAVVYAQLPEKVATHFDLHGQPDGWSGKGLAAFGIPCFMLAMFGVFNALPKLLPRKRNLDRFEDTYWLITTLVLAYMAIFHVVVVGKALGWPIDIPTAVLLSIGSMFVILGNLLPRVKSNWIMGIRTPWTLESESVWRETHRLGGKTMMLGGLITMVAAFLPARIQPIVGIAALAIGAFVPVVYSYILWRREKQIAG